MKKLLLILMFITLSVQGFSQLTINSEPLVDIFRERIYMLIGYLSDITHDTDSAMRVKCGMAALKCFVGEGGSYTLSGVAHSGATIESVRINSLGMEVKNMSPVKVYIARLIGKAKFGIRVKCTIEKATICQLNTSSLEMVGDSIYEGYCDLLIYDRSDKTSVNHIRYFDRIPHKIITRLSIEEPMPDEIILLADVKISESIERMSVDANNKH